MLSTAVVEGTKVGLRTQVTTASEGAISILLIGPLDAGRGALRNILTPPQWEIREAATYGEAVRILSHRDIARGIARGIAVAICDTEIEDRSWQVLLADLQGVAHPLRLIVSSRLADERLWAEVLNLGGYDVLAQPFDRGEVLRVARMAWMDWRQKCQSQTAEAYGDFCAEAAS